ncbi:hypothetical protein LLH00_05045 [bacterium]|nr:hypothetical protein [bacterium]
MHQTRSVLAVAVLSALALALPELHAWNMKDEAGHILEVGGHMQYRGRYYDLDFISDGDQSEKGSLNRHNYYGDLSLTFGITPNENVKVFFELNKLIFLGQEFKYNTIQTGEEVMQTDFTLPDGTKIPVRLNTDEAWEPHLRQAWLDVKIPNTKMKLKFGRQGFMLGNGIYTNTNIASVFGYQFYTDLGPDKPSFRAGSMKFFEGIRENYNSDLKVNDCDDADMFFGDVSLPVQKSKLGAFLAYFRDNSYNLDLLSHVNLGLTADLALPAGWTLKSEFDYQNGAKKFGANSTQPDIDWTGWCFMVNAAAPPLLDKKLRLSFEYGIGSGDDPSTPNKFEGYVGVGPFYPYAWAYEYRFIHMNHNASHFYGLYSKGMAENLAPGLENTTYAKAQAVFMLPGKATYVFSPIYLRMTEPVPGKDMQGNPVNVSSKTFGWEYDNIVTVPVYKNFSYQFIFAAIFPGKWMKARGYEDMGYGIRSQLEVVF